MPEQIREVRPVLGVPIDAITAESACDQIWRWAERRESRVVCLCNAHSLVTAARDPLFMQAVCAADLATPDGAPVAWMLRRMGTKGQQRVSGPDLMELYCERAARAGQSIFLFGSTETTLQQLRRNLCRRWPALRIAGALSPPFRELSPSEDATFVRQINASEAGTIWVSLGCPKQELWMNEHRGQVQGVMIGVGAAFDFHAGTVSRAPPWMRDSGIEWLHRLFSEPRRLWKRYLVTNTWFLVAAVRQLMRR